MLTINFRAPFRKIYNKVEENFTNSYLISNLSEIPKNL